MDWIDFSVSKPKRGRRLLCYRENNKDGVEKYFSDYAVLRWDGRKFYHDNLKGAYCSQCVVRYAYIDD